MFNRKHKTNFKLYKNESKKLKLSNFADKNVIWVFFIFKQIFNMVLTNKTQTVPYPDRTKNTWNEVIFPSI